MASGTSHPKTSTRSLAFVGLTIALLTVSAWVAVPLGPVPFTLQTFVLVFAVIALSPKESVAAVAGYVALGAIGLPVFSSMRGGIGVLAGPTGGFLWGFLLGAVVASAFLHVARMRKGTVVDGSTKRNTGRVSKMRAWAIDLIAGLLLLAVAYCCGWMQLMAVAALGPLAAFAAGVAPFLPIEVAKLVAAVATARAVRSAVTLRTTRPRK